MGEVKLATVKGTLTAAQEISSDQLDTLAHVYGGVKLSLDDTGEILSDVDVTEQTMPNVTVDGCYSDAKEAVEDKFNTTVNNTGETYQRILDSEVKKVLATNMYSDEDADIVASDFEALTSIGSWFRGNNNIVSFTELAESGVTLLGNNQFYGCSNLEYIDITKIKSMRYNIFRECSSLKEIELGSELTTLSEFIFANCSSLAKSIYPSLEFMLNLGWYDVYNPLYGGQGHLYFANDKDSEVTSLVIPEGITEIKKCTFAGARYVTSITLPSTLISIGNNALSYGVPITEITIPHGVTNIGDFVFYNDTALASVIYDGTVAECKAITWGTTPFSRCTKMLGKTITCSDDTVSIDSSGNVVTE